MARSSLSLGKTKMDGESIYIIAFAFFLMVTNLSGSTITWAIPTSILRYLSFISLALILFKVFFLDQLKIRQFFLNIFFLALLVFTWRTSQEYLLLPMGIFILGSRGVNFRRIIQTYFVMEIICLLFVMLIAALGLIPSLTFTRIINNEIVERHSFGVVYPTNFAAHILYLALAYCWLKFNSLNWKDYCVFIVLAAFIYKETDARFDTILLILLMPVMFVGQRASQGKIQWRYLASLYWFAPAVSFVLMTIGTIFYSPQNTFLKRANDILSGRLFYGHKAFTKYGVNLFGQFIPQKGWGGLQGYKMYQGPGGFQYFYIDSAYIRLLLMYGIVTVLAIVIIMTILSFKSMSSMEFSLASVLFIIAIDSIFEQYLVDLMYDPFLLALLADYGAEIVLSTRKDQTKV